MTKLHLICNAHIDPVWLWDWEEGAASAISTFQSAVTLASDYEYIFCQNDALLYQWVEEYEPTLFAEIQKLCKLGKWKVVGGWYLQPDSNLLSGEALVRQIMTGRKYFKEHFNQTPTTAVNFDSFGHSSGLVQILRKCGYDSYLICRPGNVEWEFDDDFLWIGPDGSQIRVCRVSEHYNSGLGHAVDKINKVIESKSTTDIGIVLWGVGNHGGGPSRIDLENINKLMQGKDIEILHSTPEAYFTDRSDKELPVVSESLTPCMPGCYTSMVRIKQKYRDLENQLFLTEKLCTTATALGLINYPASLNEACDYMLRAGFHDILPGTSVPVGEETGLRWIDHGLEIANRERAKAFFAMALGGACAQPGEYPILVYNPHPHKVITNIEVSFIMESQNYDDTFTNFVVHSSKKALPTQVIKEDTEANLDWVKKLIFQCELNPSGLTRFDAKPYLLKSKPQVVQPSGDVQITTRNAKACISAETGFLNHYEVDGSIILNTDVEVVIYPDNADPWAMDLKQRKKLAQGDGYRFKLLTPEDAAAFAGVQSPLSPIKLTEDGSVMTECETLLGCESSRLRIRYRLYKDSGDMDVLFDLHYQEKDKMVKWRVQTAFEGTMSGQIPYAVDSLRQDGSETYAHKWVRYDGSDLSFAILNKGTYGLSCEKNTIEYTLVRGAAYAAHPIPERPILRDNRYVRRFDQGELNYFFRLTAGKPVDILESVQLKADIINENPFSLQMFPTGNSGVEYRNFIELSNGSVVMSVCKMDAEGRPIVRLHNSSDHASVTLFRCDHFMIAEKLSFSPHEFKTLRLHREFMEICTQPEI
jgi:alpha-mannosidase